MPSHRPSVFPATRAFTLASARPLKRAMRGTWYIAAAGLMCGSSPLPDAVTRSTGMGDLLAGSAASNAEARVLTASASAGFVGPKFDPPDAIALSGKPEVADG